MHSITITARVGPDGVLICNLGPEFANCDVQVTVERLLSRDESIEEHRKFIEQIAGSWQGDFEGPEQPPYEERDPL